MKQYISRYEDDYSALPFEEEQEHIRRIELLKVLQSVQPKRVLEVGCGRLPLFADYQSFEEMVVVEPGARFAQSAVDLAGKLAMQDRIRVEHAFLEEEDVPESDFDGDLVLNLSLDHNLSPGLFIENDYAYRFAEVIPEFLATMNARHVHVGDISQGAKDEILDRLAKAGVDRDRFLHIPVAARLGDVFVEQSVDVLIQTFPIGGGLVAIEAMLANRDYFGSPVDEEWTRELYDYPLEIRRILGNRETTRGRPFRIEKFSRSIRSLFS